MKKMQNTNQHSLVNKGTVIIADDDQAIRTILNQALLRAGYQTRLADNAQTLWQWVSSHEGDLIITDVIFPEQNIFDFLPRMKELRPTLPVIVISAQNTFMTAIKASESGAYDYLAKPFDLQELMNIVSRALAEKDINANIKDETLTDSMPLIGRSAVMQDVYRTLARLVQTDLTVLITGESGTGKELIARALHNYGKRKNKPFVAINMAAIPRDLIESELFGHEKGSFTGANARSIGRFEQANHGTLFLDEIGDMPMEAQTRLLRVLQQNEYMSVGGTTPIKTNVRIVAATNKNLQSLIQQGLFREDLFYRLNVVPLQLPPLRKRPEDIEDLSQHFLQNAAKEDGLPQKHLTQDAIERMKQYSWPGNVRELENMMRRLTALYPQEHINVDVVNIELHSAHNNAPLTNDINEEISIEKAVEVFMQRFFSSQVPNNIPNGLYYHLLNKIEPPLIRACLQAAQGNQIKAADILGLNRNTLRKKIKELGINIYENE